MERIAVVGGGPAGAAAALTLARGGADVTLFVPRRPGEKPCGGAVPDYLLPRLDGFDASGLEHVSDPPAVLETELGGRFELSLRGIRIFRRGDLDAALVEAAIAAGARCVRAKARRVDASPDGVTIVADDQSHRFGWAIGADGARGRSRRAVGLEPRDESLGIGATLRDFAWRSLVVAFPDAGDAYLWIFPRPGGASVGIAFSPSRLSRGAAAACLESFLERHLPPEAAGAGSSRYRYPIPVFTPATVPGLARAVKRRLLPVGDAAALADPLTREGIRPAVLSGRWAARCLLDGRPEDYPERVRGSLAGEMRRAARARDLFFEDRLVQAMIPLCRGHRGIARVLADLLACRQPYATLRRRLLSAAVLPTGRAQAAT